MNGANILLSVALIVLVALFLTGSVVCVKAFLASEDSQDAKGLAVIGISFYVTTFVIAALFGLV